jgi:septin family protein
MSETALVAGGISIMPPSAENMQLSMLLWGDSGSGKTTLAATAPGTKLYLLFDPGGDLSLAGRVMCWCSTYQPSRQPKSWLSSVLLIHTTLAKS